MSKIGIIYWSGTGNTENFANALSDELKALGAAADVHNIADAEVGISDYDVIAFGCPAMGAEVLEESSFDPYFTSIEGELSGKKVALFGSYGWGDGEWMRNWQDRVESDGAVLIDEPTIFMGEMDVDAEASVKNLAKLIVG